MKWITRARPKVDRIACPWLIRKFVDPDAEFLYVPPDQVMAVAEREGATPYDVPGAVSFNDESAASRKATDRTIARSNRLTSPSSGSPANWITWL